MVKPIEEKDLEVNILRYYWEKFKSLDKFTKSIVITTVLFLIFASVITTITLSLRSSAGGGGTIARVEINPGSVQLAVGQKQALSTLAYDYNGAPMFSGVVYEWSMSSTNSVATLSRAISDITELTALKAGCGQLTVIARDGISTVTKSIQVVVSDKNTVPACAPVQKINWVTNEVTLSADNLTISLNGKTYSPSENTTFGSNPVHLSDGYYLTDIQGDWTSKEDGSQMSLRLDFKYIPIPGQFWTLYSVRTLDGKTNTNWIYYPPVDGNNQPIQNALGDSYIAPSLNFSTNSASSAAIIHFDGVHITPFKTLFTPTPTPGSHPIGIGSSDVSLNAGNFYMDINGKRYYGTKPMDLHSNISKPYPSKTTLEAIWHENGVEMRLFIYFRIDPTISSRWEIYDIRTYDGNTSGEWLYYPADRSWGNFGNLGYSAIWQKLELRSKNGRGFIHFDDLKLFPFKNFKAPTPTPFPPPPTITPTSSVPFTFNNTVKADAYVTKTGSSGNSTKLIVDGNPISNTYLKFDLTSLKGKKLLKATLVLNNTDKSTTKFFIKSTSSSWSENTIKFSNAPASGQLITTFSSPRKGFIYIDITNYLQSKVGSTVSLFISTDSQNGAVFTSKESDKKPYLILTTQ